MRFINLTQCILLSSIASLSTAFAANHSILDTSIHFNNENNKAVLLKTVSQWEDKTIQSFFQTYKHPEEYKLPHPANTQQYNVQFINAFWGPLNNPFNQYPRPAKAFVFIPSTSIS